MPEQLLMRDPTTSTALIPFGYLTATSYSGSTLLSMLMNSHPEIASIGELANSVKRAQSSDGYFCSCGAEISQCEFWLAVRNRCAESGLELDLYDFQLALDMGWGHTANKLIYGVPIRFEKARWLLDLLVQQLPAHKRNIQQVTERTAIIVRSILSVTTKSVFFDVSKGIRRAMYLAEDDRLQLKLIHLVRDPRAVLYSFLRRKSNARVDKVISYWIRTHTNALRLKSRLEPSNYLLVRYEDLCEEPDLTLSGICSFLGVEDYSLTTNVGSHKHHIIGNAMRNRPFSGIKADDEWRTNLPLSISARCENRTARIADELGHQRLQ